MWQKVQRKYGELGGHRFTFHDIRAKALTDAKRSGLDAQALAGHASPQMTEQYIKAREVEPVHALNRRILDNAPGNIGQPDEDAA